MKTFRHILLYLHAALILGIATACHDDLASPTPDHEPKIGTGIVLKIPNMNKAARFASRATGDADLTTNEGVVNNDDLWLLIYSADGVTDKTHNFAIQLPMVDELTTEYKGDGPYQIENGGETYTYVPMYPGNYRAYVVANLSEYAQFPEGNETVDFEEITEAKLKTLVHNFEGVYNNAANETRKVLRPGHLPMVCLPTNVVGADDDGNFDILDKNISELKCDLEFLCSKVRYTILFDNSGTEKDNMDGFSQGAFGKDHFIDFIDATIAKVGNLTPILKDSYTLSYMTGSHGIPLDAVEYPKRTDEQEKHYFHNGECTPDTDTGKTNLEDFKTTNLPKHEEDYEDSDTQRAWQGVIYIPENLETADDSRTVITFNGEVTGFGDNAVPYSYTFPLIKGKSSGTETSSNLRRGKFYDVTLQVTGLKTMEIGFEITDFVTKTLLYDLQGPVYLNVQETNITVSAGSETSFEYSTNGQIDYYCPKWHNPTTGEDIDFYDIKFKEGKVIVTINSQIPAEELKKIENDATLKKQYMFFHLTSGNIHKKITVVPLSLKSFLMVDPEEITIDVREQIASGKYSGTIQNGGAFEITVRTNLPEYTITAEDWDELVANTGANTSNLMYLADKDGNKVQFGIPRSVTDGRETLYLVYDRLNSGEKFWSETSHSMTLNFTVDDDDVMPDYIDIHTRPSNDNYIIHMRGPAGMTDPHIYIYQCLEIPGWYNLNGDYKFANQPIGFKDGTGEDDYFAALEYSYTGRVSFLGWQESANSTLLDGINSTWGKDHGFYMMDALKLTNGTTTSSHYDLEYDFFYDYRYGLKEDGKTYRCACDECRTDIKKVWPGIRMESEGGDWWKIDLTGAATPGKTLIMFANGHGGGDPRYPQHAKVGLTLFDYPSREGWVDLSTGDLKNDVYTFTSENLQETQKVPTSGKQKFLIVWYKNYSQQDYDRIRMMSPVTGDNLSPMGWLDDNKPYYEVIMDLDDLKTLKWQLYKVGNAFAESREFTASFSDFQWNASKRAFELKDHCHF